ncbi:hypothetical protein KDA23_07285 [Candidatus Saccharibacteria bacterium]|nr:hypothetical protein [Candidatus Saccharibacteria bacterium]
MKKQKTKNKNKSLKAHQKRQFPRNVLLLTVLAVSLGLLAAKPVSGYLMSYLDSGASNSNAKNITDNRGNLNEKPLTTDQSGTTKSDGGGSKASEPKKATTTSKPSTSKKTTTTSTEQKTTTKKTSTKASSGSSSASSDIASESDCPGQSDVSKTATVLVCMTSFARIYHHLGSVSASTSLMNSATAKAQDIADCGFSHTACGRTFNYWFGVKGYSGGCQGENIAQGQTSPGEVFEAWMNSPSHRDNILYTSFDDLGVASLNDSGGIIWVMHLGGC